MDAMDLIRNEEDEKNWNEFCLSFKFKRAAVKVNGHQILVVNCLTSGELGKDISSLMSLEGLPHSSLLLVALLLLMLSKVDFWKLCLA